MIECVGAESSMDQKSVVVAYEFECGGVIAKDSSYVVCW